MPASPTLLAPDGGVCDRTGLSPEWDRWFDEEFTDLLSSDQDWVSAEFDALIAASWPPPPPVPPVPAPAAAPGHQPPGQPPAVDDSRGGGHTRRNDNHIDWQIDWQRSPPPAVTEQEDDL